MVEVALIGPTASGKSDMAFELAQKRDAIILSLDSLSVYKYVDIASAKPSKEELEIVEHFGIDIVMPNEEFNVVDFFLEYQRAKKKALELGKNLIIVGGSSFYLKAMIDGLTDMPPISKEAREMANEDVSKDLKKAFEKLLSLDAAYASKIKPQDSYRIARGLEIFYEFKKPPSVIFKTLPKKKIESHLEIYEILVDRELLRKRIRARSAKMMELGIVDETKMLLDRWGDKIKPIKSIGPKECLAFIRGEITKKECEELISIHTAQLAKRQVTFNKTQLNPSLRGEASEIKKRISTLLS